jgi:hypothetical protein
MGGPTDRIEPITLGNMRENGERSLPVSCHLWRHATRARKTLTGRNGITEQSRGLTGEQIGALEMLAHCPAGCTKAVLNANGFTV